MADEHAHHDPTFYRSPQDAAAGPPEKLAYVAAFSRPADKPGAVPDLRTASAHFPCLHGWLRTRGTTAETAASSSSWRARRWQGGFRMLSREFGATVR